MQTIKWTTAEHNYPHINLIPDQNGENECPSCHGCRSHRVRNMATLSPSDDYDETCRICGGEGTVIIEDDRYA